MDHHNPGKVARRLKWLLVTNTGHEGLFWKGNCDNGGTIIITKNDGSQYAKVTQDTEGK